MNSDSNKSKKNKKNNFINQSRSKNRRNTSADAVDAVGAANTHENSNAINTKDVQPKELAFVLKILKRHIPEFPYMIIEMILFTLLKEFKNIRLIRKLSQFQQSHSNILYSLSFIIFILAFPILLLIFIMFIILSLSIVVGISYHFMFNIGILSFIALINFSLSFPMITLFTFNATLYAILARIYQFFENIPLFNFFINYLPFFKTYATSKR
ncbi:uncharacterized protein ASCRUDRAFT_108297 [Ascoidea rubescens DSM 1968]|uniref:Uncharacterized protein n=1 Tax=Ascoidea rubescens DSM 1968 TaxID=1344418 RepID=A0A1D2VE72_9ASCO|nr:hypothetical protein ASCRUDRAFT_108297 [Ascoidea rubescens DSM 1968]ODV59926.1 hypothetical protein ASCRUDRAFT_108297 [Ascoidea rubescens DSM 1968]